MYLARHHRQCRALRQAKIIETLNPISSPDCARIPSLVYSHSSSLLHLWLPKLHIACAFIFSSCLFYTCFIPEPRTWRRLMPVFDDAGPGLADPVALGGPRTAPCARSSLALPVSLVHCHCPFTCPQRGPRLDAAAGAGCVSGLVCSSSAPRDLAIDHDAGPVLAGTRLSPNSSASPHETFNVPRSPVPAAPTTPPPPP